MKIKFCSIEHTTKSTWKYQKGRPNYLCNSNKEIDPTSFGCWTSAFKGEHLSLEFLRFGHNYRNNLFNKIHIAREKITGSKIYKNIDYIKQFNVILVLLHKFSLSDMADFLSILREANNNAIILGSLAHCPGLIRKEIQNKKSFKEFLQCLKKLDLFINVYPETQEYFEILAENLTFKLKEKIIPFLQFFPINFVKKFKQSYEKKEKIIHLAGPTDREDNLANQYIAIALQKKFPEFLITINQWENLNIEPLKLARARYKILPQMKWQDYLKELSRSFMVINLDNIWTLGRVVSDCAGVGTPCIGINATNQFRMFPKLRIDDIAGLKKAIELGERLIQEKVFYQETVDYAKEKIEKHGYKKRKRALLKVLTEKGFEF